MEPFCAVDESMPGHGPDPRGVRAATATGASPMRLIARWWKGGTGVVAAEYLLLAAIVGIALVVGCTNLATALYVGTNDLPAPTSGDS